MKIEDVYLPGLESVNIPPLIKIGQKIDDCTLTNQEIRSTLYNQLEKNKLSQKISIGDSIAITAGSRKIDKFKFILKLLINYLKNLGCNPFIVPAMGSHGGGTAKGQKEILCEYGILPNNISAPIKSSMKVKHVGNTANDIPVYCDELAANADGIIIINRIKVHTGFSGKIESGLMKMMAIGLGKHKGALKLHSYGLESLCTNIQESAEVIMENTPVLLGIGLIENNYSKLSSISVLNAKKIKEKEKELLSKQKNNMLGLPFEKADILIVDEIGKDISGSGMDNNIIGRFKTNNPIIKFIIPLSLTKASKGNAVGIGVSDFITKIFFESIDFATTYTNLLTAGCLNDARLPIVLKDARTAIKMAILLSNKPFDKLSIARIKNTSSINKLKVSENIYKNLKDSNRITNIDNCLRNIEFNSKGEMIKNDFY